MNICGVYFSPTGTTEKVIKVLVNSVSDRLDQASIRLVDFTPLSARQKPLHFQSDDLVLFGMPIYAGRVPNLMLPFLRRIKGAGAQAVAVVVYGNRHFDDGLVELVRLLERAGMQVIAAGAFIGQHAFSNTLAQGRPDETDLGIVESFAQAIVEKLSQTEYGTLDLPGDHQPTTYYQPRNEYGSGIDIRPVKPVTDMDRCTDCKLCARICPLGSIDFADVSHISGICMKCCACVKCCPVNAKTFVDQDFLFHVKDLEQTCQTRRDAGFWI